MPDLAGLGKMIKWIKYIASTGDLTNNSNKMFHILINTFTEPPPQGPYTPEQVDYFYSLIEAFGEADHKVLM